MNTHRNQSYWAGTLLVILATAFWSSSGLFITLITKGSGISAQGLAFWRDLGAFTFLLVGLALFRPQLLKVHRHDLPWLATMGAISIGMFHVLWNTSVIVNGVAVATVLQANAPVFVTIVAWLLWKEPLTVYKILAVGLAFIGTVLIAGIDSLGLIYVGVLGLVVGLGSALTYGTLTLFGKALVGNYSPWTVLVYIFGFGALALLPFQINLPFPWPQPLPVVGYYVGLVLITNVLGFALYTAGLRQIQASVAAILGTAEVLFAAIVAYVVLHERLDWVQILGAGLVVAGVVLLSWSRTRNHREVLTAAPG